MGAIVEGTLGGFGAYAQGHAKAEAANYNAALAIQNANIQKQNATIAGQSGSQQAAMQSLKTRAMMGSERANQAASGINVNSGSAIDTQASTHEIGALDAMTVRTNAAREAHGYRVQATNQEAQGNLDKYEANYDEQSGIFNAGTTFLSTVDNAAKNMAKMSMAGGM
jgi:hypothetical protein